MDELFEDLMVKGDGDMAKLRGQQQFQDALAQCEADVNLAVEEHIATTLSHQEAKDKERADFMAAIDYAKNEAAVEAKAEIAAYNALAKKSLTEASEQPYAVIQNLHKANDALFEKLMDLEMSASERYSESIHSFESSYEELAKKTFEVISVFFGRLREIETAYHEKIIAGGSELIEKVAAEQGEYMAEEVRTMLSDKDTCMVRMRPQHTNTAAALTASPLTTPSLPLSPHRASSTARMMRGSQGSTQRRTS